MWVVIQNHKMILETYSVPGILFSKNRSSEYNFCATYYITCTYRYKLYMLQRYSTFKLQSNTFGT